MKRLPAWIPVSLLFIVSCCDSKQVFEGKKDFSERYWVFNNPAEFEFEINETDKAYNLLFNIRNTAKYQYQNIYLQYYLEDSTGRLLSRELKNIQLFNAKTGVPYGKGLGGIYNIKKTFLEEYSFENKGKYKLRIDQFMRQDSLPEILSVGLRVEYAE
ncbi:MAG: gliding motility lipoprotein GldH [Cyclobacteriaceae bacterium]|nr:gliding motility lipoprotein GldH [Cyclobacteriaceae bacterium]